MHAKSSLVLITLLLILEQGFVQADDWPQWRGPLRNNIYQETGLLKTWPEGGPQRRRCCYHALLVSCSCRTRAILQTRCC